MKKNQKISHISAITIIIGAAIGAGIFFKNGELVSMSQGNLILVLIVWLIAAVGIISLAFALSKIAIIKESNRGLLGWTSVFLPRFLHKAVANYKKFFFIPIMVFALSLYITSSLVDAGLPLTNGWSVLLVAFSIFVWLMITNLISLRFSEISQWIMTILQTLPLIIIPILAFINFGNVGAESTIWQKKVTNLPVGFAGVSQYIVLILGLPSVLFSFGGFHAIATQRDNLKEPERLGKALITAIIVIVITYLFLTIAFNVGSSSGTHRTVPMPTWLRSIFDICIAFGIMSIVNGLLMSALTQWKNIMLLNQSHDLTWLHYQLFKKNPQASTLRHQIFTVWSFFFGITTLFFLVFGLIGIYIFPNPSNWEATKYGRGGGLYGIADILSNYTGLMILTIIASTVLGVLVRHKKQQIIQINWSFKIFAFISLTLFYSALLFTLIGALIDMTGFNNADIWANSMKMIVFLLTIGISLSLGVLNIYQEKKSQKMTFVQQ